MIWLRVRIVFLLLCVCSTARQTRDNENDDNDENDDENVKTEKCHQVGVIDPLHQHLATKQLSSVASRQFYNLCFS